MNITAVPCQNDTWETFWHQPCEKADVINALEHALGSELILKDGGQTEEIEIIYFDTLNLEQLAHVLKQCLWCKKI